MRIFRKYCSINVRLTALLFEVRDNLNLPEHRGIHHKVQKGWRYQLIEAANTYQVRRK